MASLLGESTVSAHEALDQPSRSRASSILSSASSSSLSSVPSSDDDDDEDDDDDADPAPGPITGPGPYSILPADCRRLPGDPRSHLRGSMPVPPGLDRHAWIKFYASVDRAFWAGTYHETTGARVPAALRPTGENRPDHLIGANARARESGLVRETAYRLFSRRRGALDDAVVVAPVAAAVIVPVRGGRGGSGVAARGNGGPAISGVAARGNGGPAISGDSRGNGGSVISGVATRGRSGLTISGVASRGHGDPAPSSSPARTRRPVAKASGSSAVRTPVAGGRRRRVKLDGPLLGLDEETKSYWERFWERNQEHVQAVDLAAAVVFEEEVCSGGRGFGGEVVGEMAGEVAEEVRACGAVDWLVKEGKVVVGDMAEEKRVEESEDVVEEVVAEVMEEDDELTQQQGIDRLLRDIALRPRLYKVQRNSLFY